MVPAYLARIHKVCEKFEPVMVTDKDEMVWLDVEGRGKVIARKGSKRILVVVKGNEKANIRMVGTICMSGAKSRSIHVLKGASDRLC
jgi:hypothetical protein